MLGNDDLAQVSTLDGPGGAGPSGSRPPPRVPALTILAHPDPARVGERARLATSAVILVSRIEPLFAQLLDGLRAIPGVRLFGPCDPARQVAVVSFTLTGRHVSDVALELDEEYGFGAGPGSIARRRRIARSVRFPKEPFARQPVGVIEEHK